MNTDVDFSALLKGIPTGKRMASEFDMNKAFEEVTYAAQMTFGTECDAEQNHHWRTIEKQLQAMLDKNALEGGEHPFDSDKGEIDISGMWDGYRVNGRSFMTCGFTVKGQPNTREYLHVTDLSEGTDNHENFRAKSGGRFLGNLHKLQKDGFTDKDGKCWKVNLVVIADWKALCEAYQAPVHAGRDMYTHQSKRFRAMKHPACNLFCNGVGDCSHVSRLTLDMIDEVSLAVPPYLTVLGYTGSPYVNMKSKEGTTIASITERRDRVAKMISNNIIATPDAISDANKMDSLVLQNYYDRWLTMFEVTRYELVSTYIKTAFRERLEKMLRQRFPKESCDKMTDINEMKNVMENVLECKEGWVRR